MTTIRWVLYREWDKTIENTIFHSREEAREYLAETLKTIRKEFEKIEKGSSKTIKSFGKLYSIRKATIKIV